MSLEIDQPEELGGGGNFVDQPGVYHFLVAKVNENPADKNGNPLNGLDLTLTCLKSTANGQEGKSLNLMLWKPTADDNSDMPKKKLTRFCLATCLIGQHVPGQKAVVEPTDAVGRQLVAKLSWRQKKNEQTGKWEDTDRVDLHYSDIWHIDDPDVSKNGWPLDEDAISMLPLELRKIPDPPAADKTVTPAAVADPAAAVTAAAGSVDIDDV